jgi:predicted nucleic acid-binding protein
MILLDTSVLIEMFREKDKAKTFFSQLLERETEFAIAHRLPIATTNTKHFKRVADLIIIER